MDAYVHSVWEIQYHYTNLKLLYLGMVTIATGKLESAERGCHSTTSLLNLFSIFLAIMLLLNHTNQDHLDHAHLQDALEELTALAECVNEAEPQSSLFNQQQELLIMMDGLAEVCNIADFINT